MGKTAVTPEAGQWIAEQLAPYWQPGPARLRRGTVESTVPHLFEAYARIFHRVLLWREGTLSELRWRDVTEQQGTRWHPRMQWASVAGSLAGAVYRGGYWDAADPRPGILDPTQRSLLARVLTAHTGTPQDAYFALWEGYGWLHSGASVTVVYTGDGEGTGEDREALAAREALNRPAFAAGQLDAPRLDIADGCRAYHLFRGPVADYAGDTWGSVQPAAREQSANLAWPADRRWCLATEIDFDSTLIGGSAALVDAVVAHPGLEAARVTPGTSLQWNADTVNPGPGTGLQQWS
ncbi:MAG: hypothetical protein ACHP7K_08890 [Actinomycetales bacterium]|jgi:hypothetical protein